MIIRCSECETEATVQLEEAERVIDKHNEKHHGKRVTTGFVVEVDGEERLVPHPSDAKEEYVEEITRLIEDHHGG